MTEMPILTGQPNSGDIRKGKDQAMGSRFNSPPNWRTPQFSDWVPPPGWLPDPSWGPAPYGWSLWVDDPYSGVRPSVVNSAAGPAPFQLPGKEQPPNNHLTWAWIATLGFCWPLGIPAIVYASRVNKKWAVGDVWGARQDSRHAKTFAIWSMCVGVVLLVIVMGAG
jgi:hypothetical protein